MTPNDESETAYAVAAMALTIKTNADTVRRMDALIPWACTQPRISPIGRASRSDVHRAALEIGLATLERRAKGGG